MRRDGQVPSIDTLVEEYAGFLYRLAHRLTGSSADAEDLVQETFLTAHQNLDQVRDGRAVRVWLVKVLRSRLSRWLQQRRPATGVDLDEIPADAGVDPDWTEEIDPARLQSVLDQLPFEHREVLVLFYFREFRYREIAELLDCPLGTVMSRLARAKAQLRARLAPLRVDDAAP